MNPLGTPRILARTERWLVVDKPAGWLVIPGRGSGVEPVLVDWATREAGTRAWVVHRIDRETSGIVLFALTADAHKEANAWFEQKKVRKRYLCLASASPSLPVFKVNRPVEGKPSVSQVEVRERLATGAFLAAVTPLSGRRHQIRIHLSEEGYPLLGDTTYGGARVLGTLEIKRVALHAAALALPSGESFEAPLPDDFESWLRALRGAA